MVSRILEFDTDGVMLGWTSRLEKKRSTFKLTLKKEIADGCSFQGREELCGYYLGTASLKSLVREEDGDRPICVFFLDGKNRHNSRLNQKDGEKR